MYHHRVELAPLPEAQTGKGSPAPPSPSPLLEREKANRMMLTGESSGCNFQNSVNLIQETPEDVGPSRESQVRPPSLLSLSTWTLARPLSEMTLTHSKSGCTEAPAGFPFSLHDSCPITGVPFSSPEGQSGSIEILFLLSICSIRITENQSHLTCCSLNRKLHYHASAQAQ